MLLTDINEQKYCQKGPAYKIDLQSEISLYGKMPTC